MLIKDLKLNTIQALEKANDEGLKMLGAGIAKAFFLKTVMMFIEGFGLSPAAVFTGQFQDARHGVLYAQMLQTLIENIAFLYGLTKGEVMAVIDETTIEMLEGFKQQLEQKQ